MLIFTGCVAGAMLVFVPAWFLREKLFFASQSQQEVLVDFVDIDEVGYGNEE